jgi:hypothetical protein
MAFRLIAQRANRVLFSCLYQAIKSRAALATRIRVIEFISHVLNPKTLDGQRFHFFLGLGDEPFCGGGRVLIGIGTSIRVLRAKPSLHGLYRKLAAHIARD